MQKALSIEDYTITKVVQANHHEDDVRYGISRGIQYSCVSLISLSWTLFSSPGQWDKFDLDGILGKEGHLFKSISKLIYLGIEELPREFCIECLSVNVPFLKNNSGKITAETYLVFLVEIVNSVQQIGTDTLSIVSNCFRLN